MAKMKNTCRSGISQRQVRMASTNGRMTPRNTKGSSIKAGTKDAHELACPLRLSIIIATSITDTSISPLPKQRAGAHNQAKWLLACAVGAGVDFFIFYSCFLPKLGSILMNLQTRKVAAQQSIAQRKKYRYPITS